MLTSYNTTGADLYPDSKVHGDNMGPSRADRTQVGPMLAPWTLVSGYAWTAVLSKWLLLSGEPDYFGRNKISSGGDLSHYSSASLY